METSEPIGVVIAGRASIARDLVVEAMGFEDELVVAAVCEAGRVRAVAAELAPDVVILVGDAPAEDLCVALLGDRPGLAAFDVCGGDVTLYRGPDRMLRLGDLSPRTLARGVRAAARGFGAGR